MTIISPRDLKTQAARDSFEVLRACAFKISEVDCDATRQDLAEAAIAFGAKVVALDLSSLTLRRWLQEDKSLEQDT